MNPQKTLENCASNPNEPKENNFGGNTEMKIREFCNSRGIKWFPIRIRIEIDENGNQKKFFDGKDIKLGYVPKTDDFKKLDDKVLKSRQEDTPENFYEYIAIDTRIICQVDVDENEENYDYLKKVKTPYFLSATKKMPHFFVIRDDPEDDKRYKNQSSKPCGKDIDYLNGVWGWCHKDQIVKNSKKEFYKMRNDFFDISNLVGNMRKAKLNELSYNDWIKCIFCLKKHIKECGYDDDFAEHYLFKFSTNCSKYYEDNNERNRETAIKNLKYNEERTPEVGYLKALVGKYYFDNGIENNPYPKFKDKVYLFDDEDDEDDTMKVDENGVEFEKTKKIKKTKKSKKTDEDEINYKELAEKVFNKHSNDIFKVDGNCFYYKTNENIWSLQKFEFLKKVYNEWVVDFDENPKNYPLSYVMFEILYMKMPIRNDFVDKLNEYRYKFFFKNGVYDISKNEFTKYEDSEDIYYITTKIPYNFMKKDEYYIGENDKKITVQDCMDIIDERFIKKTFYTDNEEMKLIEGERYKELMNFMINYLFSNYHLKKWMVIIGDRNSGKGTLYDFLKQTFGDGMISSVNASTLVSKKFEHSDSERELSCASQFIFKKLCLSQEIKAGTVLNGALIKKIASGGDEIEGRSSHQTLSKGKARAGFILNANDIPTCDPSDAEENRLVYRLPCYFGDEENPNNSSFFREKDDSIKYLIDNPYMSMAFFWTVIDNYDKNCKYSNLKIANKNYRGENTDYKKLLSDLFVIDPTGIISVKAFNDAIHEYCRDEDDPESYSKKMKNELKKFITENLKGKFGVVRKYCEFGSENKKNTKCIEGLSKIQEEEAE